MRSRCSLCGRPAAFLARGRHGRPTPRCKACGGARYKTPAEGFAKALGARVYAVVVAEPEPRRLGEAS